MKTPPLEDEASKRKIKLMFTQVKLQNSLVGLGAKSKDTEADSPPPSPPVSTDDFLTIVPKPTLLGKQQAKKRLRAFGLAKLPVKKALETLKKEPPDEDKKVVKKTPKQDIAKSTIEEIEMIKKIELHDSIENAKQAKHVEALMAIRRSELEAHRLARHLDENRSPRGEESSWRRSSHRHSKQESKKRRSRSTERSSQKRHTDKYPRSWDEINSRNLSLDKIHQMNLQTTPYSLEVKTADAIKMLKFSTPPATFNPMGYDKTGGLDEFIPAQYIRFTEKSPKVSYSINFNRVKEFYFNRAQVYKTVSRDRRDSINAIITQSSQQKPVQPSFPLRVRNWYPGRALSTPDSQCEILEPSLGLSILQSYADDEEHEPDSKQATSPQKSPQSSKDSTKMEKNLKESKKIHRKVKRQEKKLEKAMKKANKIQRRRKSSSGEDDCDAGSQLFRDGELKTKMIIDPGDLNAEAGNGPWADSYDDPDVSGLSNCEEAQMFHEDRLRKRDESLDKIIFNGPNDIDSLNQSRISNYISSPIWSNKDIFERSDARVNSAEKSGRKSYNRLPVNDMIVNCDDFQSSNKSRQKDASLNTTETSRQVGTGAEKPTEKVNSDSEITKHKNKLEVLKHKDDSKHIDNLATLKPRDSSERLPIHRDDPEILKHATDFDTKYRNSPEISKCIDTLETSKHLEISKRRDSSEKVKHRDGSKSLKDREKLEMLKNGENPEILKQKDSSDKSKHGDNSDSLKDREKMEMSKCRDNPEILKYTDNSEKLKLRNSSESLKDKLDTLKCADSSEKSKEIDNLNMLNLGDNSEKLKLSLEVSKDSEMTKSRDDPVKRKDILEKPKHMDSLETVDKCKDNSKKLKHRDTSESSKNRDKFETLKFKNNPEISKYRGSSASQSKHRDSTEILKRRDTSDLSNYRENSKKLRRDSTDLPKNRCNSEMFKCADNPEILKRRDGSEKSKHRDCSESSKARDKCRDSSEKFKRRNSSESSRDRGKPEMLKCNEEKLKNRDSLENPKHGDESESLRHIHTSKYRDNTEKLKHGDCSELSKVRNNSEMMCKNSSEKSKRRDSTESTKDRDKLEVLQCNYHLDIPKRAPEMLKRKNSSEMLKIRDDFEISKHRDNHDVKCKGSAEILQPRDSEIFKYKESSEISKHNLETSKCRESPAVLQHKHSSIICRDALDISKHKEHSEALKCGDNLGAFKSRDSSETLKHSDCSESSKRRDDSDTSKCKASSEKLKHDGNVPMNVSVSKRSGKFYDYSGRNRQRDAFHDDSEKESESRRTGKFHDNSGTRRREAAKRKDKSFDDSKIRDTSIDNLEAARYMEKFLGDSQTFRVVESTDFETGQYEEKFHESSAKIKDSSSSRYKDNFLRDCQIDADSEMQKHRDKYDERSRKTKRWDGDKDGVNLSEEFEMKKNKNTVLENVQTEKFRDSYKMEKHRDTFENAKRFTDSSEYANNDLEDDGRKNTSVGRPTKRRDNSETRRKDGFYDWLETERHGDVFEMNERFDHSETTKHRDSFVEDFELSDRETPKRKNDSEKRHGYSEATKRMDIFAEEKNWRQNHPETKKYGATFEASNRYDRCETTKHLLGDFEVTKRWDRPEHKDIFIGDFEISKNKDESETMKRRTEHGTDFYDGFEKLKRRSSKMSPGESVLENKLSHWDKCEDDSNHRSNSRSNSLLRESRMMKSKRPNVSKKSRKKRQLNNRSTSNLRTPDTDEYHSHWESEEELKTKNNSWESDEEIPHADYTDKLHQPVRPERSLEMPLNISFRARDSPKESPVCERFDGYDDKPVCLYSEDSWERNDVLFKGDQELKELQQARRTISEERKLLEIEKRKIAEREKRISVCEKYDEVIYDTESVIIKEEIIDIPEPPVQQRPTERKTRWGNCPVKLVPDVAIKQEQTIDCVPMPQEIVAELIPLPEVGKTLILEDEYEQFMKSLSSKPPEPPLPAPERRPSEAGRKRKYSSSSTSTDSSHSTSSSSTSTSSSASEITEVPADVVQTIPVPKGAAESSVTTIYGKNLSLFNSEAVAGESCIVDSTSSPMKKIGRTEGLSGIDLENRKPLTAIVIAKKSKQLLDSSVFRDSDDSDSGRSRPKLEPLPVKNDYKVSERTEEIKLPLGSTSVEHEKRPRSRESSRRDPSPRRRTPPRRSRSPRRGRHSPSPSRKRGGRGPSPRRRYRDRYSPRRHRDLSPRYRDRSPRRNRSSSPYRRKRSRSRSLERKSETIQETLSRIAGMERSPVYSPLDGFRRSLADSTISDEQLMQNQEQYTSSPAYYSSNVQFKGENSSPKRIPLDDRINQVLGLEKEEPKPISTTYSQNYQMYNSQGYFDRYSGYSNQDYENKSYDFPKVSTTKVVQVGNVLQVVPAENIPTITTRRSSVTPSEPEKEYCQKILQVGNMLQIVPTTTKPQRAIDPVVPLQEKKSAEDLMKQKIAERKEDREKRRLERERRRNEKEKKQKEREKRRQLKMKQKTEEMIKKALLNEIEGNEEDIEDIRDGPKTWPTVPSILSSLSKPANKGILILSRRRLELQEDCDRQKKEVKFADGVIPGEGTSPSAGEELSSPPPASAKRFTKTKKPKTVKQPKKKIKVKIIRKSQSKSPELDEEDYDSMAPPSPPPGSPPPHVFPPRIKAAPVPPAFIASVPPPVSYQYSGRSVDSPRFIQQATAPSPVVPVYSQTVPPPRVHQSPLPVVLHHGTHYPPPSMHQSLPPPRLGVPSPQVGNLRNLPLKQIFNTSISPPQHLHHGPHHG